MICTVGMQRPWGTAVLPTLWAVTSCVAQNAGQCCKAGSFFFFFFWQAGCLIGTQYPPAADLWDPESQWASTPHSHPGLVTHRGGLLYSTDHLCGAAANNMSGPDSARGLTVHCCCNSKIKCVHVQV